MNLAILPLEILHRYLGRLVTLSANRCSIEVSNRIRAAWGKFAQHHKWLTNRQVPLHLRLKLFDSIVSPTALFATSSLPLTSAHFSRIGRAQRKMLRSIVGWVRISDEPWSDTMHRMKQRMDRAAAMHFVEPWSIRLLRNQWSFAHHLSTLDFSSWPSLTLHWIPNLVDDFSLPYIRFRSAGKPQTRWGDNLKSFSAQLVVNTH